MLVTSVISGLQKVFLCWSICTEEHSRQPSTLFVEVLLMTKDQHLPSNYSLLIWKLTAAGVSVVL